MSFTKRNLSLIVLACVIVGGICLLVVHAQASKVSYTTTTTTSSASVAAVSLATVPPRPTQFVDGINFELATSSAEQEQGLSDRSVIPDNYAMLFVFPEDGQYGFWMKDMDASLDMVWLTDDGTIASVTPNVPANSYPAVFYPPEPIKYVLETRAGFAQEKGWAAGMKIALPLPYGN
jgi:uncharacterized membrane protein (UPF0127 family)